MFDCSAAGQVTLISKFSVCLSVCTTVWLITFDQIIDAMVVTSDLAAWLHFCILDTILATFYLPGWRYLARQQLRCADYGAYCVLGHYT